jgi:dTDP-4-amino-4,6-dideoxygalactose transaminase
MARMRGDMEWPVNKADILKAIHGLFDADTWWIYKGESVRTVEARFAQMHDCAYGVSVCNGTVGIDIALRVLGIGPGDRVILPAYDFYSLPKSVLNIGATPVFVDVCPENLTIDAEQVRAVVQREDVKAVVAVHISGAVAQLDVLQNICRSAGVFLIEDCAQATGGRYAGRRVGSWGDLGVFSLGGIKLMTCGQGGIITTSNSELYEKCHALVNRGLTIDDRLNSYGIIGENYQLSELAAVTLGPQLDVLAALCEQRERRMAWLDQQLEQVDGLIPFRQFPGTTCRAQMAYSFFCDPHAMKQELLIQKAGARNIPLRKGYTTIFSDARLFSHFRAVGDCPVARTAEHSTVAIPHRHFLEEDRYWTDVVAELRALLA